MIIEKRANRHINEATRLNGNRTLREAALDLLKHGHTTLAEIERVTLHA